MKLYMFDFLRRLSSKTTQRPDSPLPPKKSSPISLYLGQVIHYYPKIQVGIIRIEKGKLAIGDLVYVEGPKTRFKQRVSSIEFNHRKVKSVGAGYEVGIQFGTRVREGDKVYITQGMG